MRGVSKVLKLEPLKHIHMLKSPWIRIFHPFLLADKHNESTLSWVFPWGHKECRNQTAHQNTTTQFLLSSRSAPSSEVKMAKRDVSLFRSQCTQNNVQCTFTFINFTACSHRVYITLGWDWGRVSSGCSSVSLFSLTFVFSSTSFSVNMNIIYMYTRLLHLWNKTYGLFCHEVVLTFLIFSQHIFLEFSLLKRTIHFMSMINSHVK